MKPTIKYMVCVNDYRNGSFLGQCEAIHIYSSGEGLLLELEDIYPSIRFYQQAPDRIRLSRRVFPIRRYNTWVGNWCWDSVDVDIKTANAIWAYLLTMKQKITAESGIEDFYEAWEAGEPMNFLHYL